LASDQVVACRGLDEPSRPSEESIMTATFHLHSAIVAFQISIAIALREEQRKFDI